MTTPADVLEIIHAALRRSGDKRINDVTLDKRDDTYGDIVLTTDDGDTVQTFVINAEGITETDGPEGE